MVTYGLPLLAKDSYLGDGRGGAVAAHVGGVCDADLGEGGARWLVGAASWVLPPRLLLPAGGLF
jgi:hypothetical protein